eukprot:s1793_g4.t1
MVAISGSDCWETDVLVADSMKGFSGFMEHLPHSGGRIESVPPSLTAPPEAERVDRKQRVVSMQHTSAACCASGTQDDAICRAMPYTCTKMYKE